MRCQVGTSEQADNSLEAEAPQTAGAGKVGQRPSGGVVVDVPGEICDLES